MNMFQKPRSSSVAVSLKEKENNPIIPLSLEEVSELLVNLKETPGGILYAGSSFINPLKFSFDVEKALKNKYLQNKNIGDSSNGVILPIVVTTENIQKETRETPTATTTAVTSPCDSFNESNLEDDDDDDTVNDELSLDGSIESKKRKQIPMMVD